MKSLSIEKSLSKSTNSIRAIAVALVGTAILFSGMSLSRLGEIEPVEEDAVAKIEVFLPPPPPPPPPEIVEEVETSQVPIQVDVALQRDPVKLDVSPIDVTLDGPPSITDKIDINLADFQRPTVDVNLDAVVFDKEEVDQLPLRNYSPMPGLPSNIRKKMGEARVIVQLSIDEKGKPLHVMVLNSPVPEARPHIIKDLKRWRFRPAKKNGQKVKCWVRFVLVFQKSNTSPFSL